MDVNENIAKEYEARVMINEEQYLNIRKHYLSNAYQYELIENENYYFDSEDLKLTNSHKVLRIRKINDQKFELTLKIQEADGCLEINQSLTSIEKDKLLESFDLKEGKIKDDLLKLGINLIEIKYITSLKTERVEVKLDKSLLVIDKNYFRNRIDYNLEVESDTENHAKDQLLSIIKEFNIEYKKDYINKAKRAIYNL